MLETRILIALVNAFWQGLIVVGLVGAALHRLRPNAASRAALWTAALVVLVALPGLNLRGAHAARSLPALTGIAQPAVLTGIPVGAALSPVRAVRTDAPPKSLPAIAALPSFPPAPRLVVHLPAVFVRMLLALLAAVALARLIGLGAAWIRLQRLVGRATPLERRVALAFGGQARSVRVLASDEIAVPVAVGLGTPAIVLPAPLVGELTHAELEQILLHEAAHLVRRDDVTNLAARAIEAILFFHPAVHIASRRLDVEREIACDDWVIAQSGRCSGYASCLTKLAAFALDRAPRPAPALGFLGRGVLRARVEHLLDAHADRLPRRARFAALAATVILAAGAALSGVRLPVVAESVKPPAPPQPPPARVTKPKAPPHPAHQARAVVRRPQPSVKPPAPPRPPAPPSFVSRDVVLVKVPSPPAPGHIEVDAAKIEADVAKIETEVRTELAQNVRSDESSQKVRSDEDVQKVRSSDENLRREIRGADWRGRDLRNRQFIGYSFVDVDMRGADLRGAQFIGSHFKNVKLQGAKLAGATLIGANFARCACAAVDFSSVRANGTNFANADLSGANFRNASLMGTNFGGANLSNATFAGARTMGTNLHGANTAGAVLPGGDDNYE
ncbi:MAG: pentapeptide repeat-containing protein [Candidatus Eremiobacteraeota bacterium]|nr:pentapeptide repeat-containing protein [Candidatus Eremiobacteraeota bacterium]